MDAILQLFVEKAFLHKGMKLSWSGKDEKEVAYDENGIVRVKINPKYYRPAEVDLLLGDSSLAKEDLKWEPKISFEQLIEMMVEYELEKIK